jgi:fumarate hydratase subunit alpha
MITASQITDTVKKLCIESNYCLGNDCISSIESALNKETNSLSKDVLAQIIENIKIASSENLPICQDTGIAVVFVEIGCDCQIKGIDLDGTINEGIRQGYKEGYLRKSVVSDPLKRKNTGDNTPAVIHYEIVAGDKLKISVLPKGAGSENTSQIKMFAPQSAIEEIENFIVQVVKDAGSRPCPPIIVGVGIGGTFEKSAILAKKTFLRSLGQRNNNLFYSEMEQRLIKKINSLNIGPMGLGGVITALDVFIDYYPCHIASLPVSVNIQCWAARHKEAVL